MPIRSLVNSSVTVEKGPTAIAVVPRHCCLSRGAFRSEPLTTHAMELSINGDRDGNAILTTVAPALGWRYIAHRTNGIEQLFVPIGKKAAHDSPPTFSPAAANRRV